MVHSDTACVRPTWIGLPVPVIRRSSAATGRKKVIEISDVVYGIAGGSVTWTAQPSGPSASRARAAPEITPCGGSNHRDAGIVNTAPTGLELAILRPYR